MRQSVANNESLRDSIKAEVADRTRRHQANIAALKAAGAARKPAAVPSAAQPTPLVLLAHGDSWFDYALVGNGPLLGDTDVIAQLKHMGNVNPLILNVSHHGDATTDELSWPKQQRMIESYSVEKLDSADSEEIFGGRKPSPESVAFNSGHSMRSIFRRSHP